MDNVVGKHPSLDWKAYGDIFELVNTSLMARPVLARVFSPTEGSSWVVEVAGECAVGFISKKEAKRYARRWVTRHYLKN